MISPLVTMSSAAIVDMFMRKENVQESASDFRSKIRSPGKD